MDQGPKGNVLLVEDDDQVRSFIRTLLTNNGYRILEARTGAEGLEIAENPTSEIDLLLSDMLLPELSGYDLAQRVLELRPQIKIMLMTGYVEGDIVQRCTSELGASFLDKPFQPATLLSRVQDAIESARNGVASAGD
jgi:two-component system cell cycle sensor histidine kinase/response regulator CckA